MEKQNSINEEIDLKIKDLLVPIIKAMHETDDYQQVLANIYFLSGITKTLEIFGLNYDEYIKNEASKLNNDKVQEQEEGSVQE